MIRHDFFSDRRTNKLPVKAIQEICSFVLLSSESIQNQLSSLSHGEGWGRDFETG